MALFYVVIRRIAIMPLTLVAITFFIYVLLELIPADPAVIFAGPDATVEMLSQARERLSLDRPLLFRFTAYLLNVLKGDLGISIATREPVLNDLLRYLPATIELTFSSVILALVLGLPIGMFSAVRNRTGGDAFIRFISFASASFPVFWLGLLFQLIFYGLLHILPFGGRLSAEGPPLVTGLILFDSILIGDVTLFMDAVKHLIMPSITLVTITFAVVVRMSRASLLEVLEEPYIQVARAKGLSSNVVLYKHALRNAAVPIITVVSARFGYLLGGAVITEAIFSWPGIGSLAVKAIKNVDYPIILGFTLMTGVIFVIVNLITDIICAFIDPRIKY